MAASVNSGVSFKVILLATFVVFFSVVFSSIGSAITGSGVGTSYFVGDKVSFSVTGTAGESCSNSDSGRVCCDTYVDCEFAYYSHSENPSYWDNDGNFAERKSISGTSFAKGTSFTATGSFFVTEKMTKSGDYWDTTTANRLGQFQAWYVCQRGTNCGMNYGQWVSPVYSKSWTAKPLVTCTPATPTVSISLGSYSASRVDYDISINNKQCSGSISGYEIFVDGASQDNVLLSPTIAPQATWSGSSHVHPSPTLGYGEHNIKTCISTNSGTICSSKKYFTLSPPQICTPDTYRCTNGNTVLEKCLSDGSNWTGWMSCGYGCDIVNGRCNSPPQTCTPNSYRCNGNVKEQCSSDGYNWTTSENCQYGCTNGACSGPYCLPLSKRCNGNNLEQCNGLTWQTLQSCNYLCESTLLICIAKPQICTPDSYRCINNTVLEKCSADGYNWTGWMSCGYGCDIVNGRCNSPPQTCTPNSYRCTNGNTVLEKCSADGYNWTFNANCNAGCNTTTNSCNLPKNVSIFLGDMSSNLELTSTCPPHGTQTATKECLDALALRNSGDWKFVKKLWDNAGTILGIALLVDCATCVGGLYACTTSGGTACPILITSGVLVTCGICLGEPAAIGLGASSAFNAFRLSKIGELAKAIEASEIAAGSILKSSYATSEYAELKFIKNGISRNKAIFIDNVKTFSLYESTPILKYLGGSDLIAFVDKYGLTINGIEGLSPEYAQMATKLFQNSRFSSVIDSANIVFGSTKVKNVLTAFNFVKESQFGEMASYENKVATIVLRNIRDELASVGYTTEADFNLYGGFYTPLHEIGHGALENIYKFTNKPAAFNEYLDELIWSRLLTGTKRTDYIKSLVMDSRLENVGRYVNVEGATLTGEQLYDEVIFDAARISAGSEIIGFSTMKDLARNQLKTYIENNPTLKAFVTSKGWNTAKIMSDLESSTKWFKLWGETLVNGIKNQQSTQTTTNAMAAIAPLVPISLMPADKFISGTICSNQTVCTPQYNCYTVRYGFLNMFRKTVCNQFISGQTCKIQQFCV